MCAHKSMVLPLGRTRQRGLSLIELMVGIVVSLLVALAAFSAANAFTAMQRQGIGVGGSAAGLATTLAALKEDVAEAGLGFFGNESFLCNRLNLSAGSTVVADGVVFAPIQVTPGAAADQIDVLYASEVAGGANVLSSTATASDETTVELASFLPVAAGSAVLLAPPSPGVPCTVKTVTANSVATATTGQVLTFADTGLHNQSGFTSVTSYAASSRVGLLGGLQWRRYRVEGEELLLEQPMDGASATVLRNVVAFRAQYGVSSAASTRTMDGGWQDPSGVWASISSTNIQRLRALRIGVVTRSPQREKPDAAGNCVATTAQPTLFGASLGLTGDWQCFRYRTMTVVVPVRNAVFGAQL